MEWLAMLNRAFLTVPEPVLFLTVWAIGMTAHYLFATRHERRAVKASAHWLSTQGKITSTRTEVISFGDEDQFRSYYPKVQYSYRIGKRSYSGSRLHFGAEDSERARKYVEREVARYKVGANVTVYYDPAKPEEAVLTRGFPTPNSLRNSAVIGLIFGLVLGLAWLIGRYMEVTPRIGVRSGGG